jgi:ribonuclease R
VLQNGVFMFYWNKCEGMVRIRDIKDDYYTFDEKQYALVWATANQLLQLGDEIFVKVKNADLVKKQLDFNFVRRIEEPLNKKWKVLIVLFV